MFIRISGHGICTNLRIVAHKRIIHANLLKGKLKFIHKQILGIFFLMFMSTSQPSYLCSLSMRHELNIKTKAKSACQGKQVCKVKVRTLYFVIFKLQLQRGNSVSINNDFLSSIFMCSGGQFHIKSSNFFET